MVGTFGDIVLVSYPENRSVKNEQDVLTNLRKCCSRKS